MPKVSIVMPSLNVGNYIEKCMESVLGQTLDDIEVICVDADSTDGTHEILERYARSDSRVRLFRDDKRSTGYAKNLGIDMARGEYVGIVEPDDYIEKDMYERLYKAAIADRADVVKCDYSVYVTLDDRHFFVPKKLAFNSSDYGVLMNPQETLKPFGWEMYTWAGIYRTDFLREKGIRHHETKGAAYQDIGFWFQCFAESERVKLIPGTGYFYCQDNPEASVKATDRFVRALDELMWVKDFYVKDKERWKYLQQAWGNEVLRFTELAANNLCDKSLEEFVYLAHKTIKKFNIDIECCNDIFRPEGYKKFEELKNIPQKFVNAYKEKYREKSSWKKRLKELINEHKNIVIVSAGSWGTNLQAMIKKSFKHEICAFADNDTAKHDKLLNGIMILSIEEAAQKYKNGVFFIANQVYGEKLKRQLIELGVTESLVEVVPVKNIVDVYL